VIHTVLRRLNEAGELRLIPRPDGKNTYLWAKPPRAMALGPEIAEFIRGMSPKRAVDAIESGPSFKAARKRTRK
jgi:hypothetical protein